MVKKMLFSKIRSEDKGSTMIIMATAMMVMLSFGALVLDIGNVALEKQKLQNAVDAASLAAAYELPDTGKAVAKAREYAQLNGVDPDDISVTFSDANKTVNVKANKTVEYFLARVMGFSSTEAVTEAAAALDVMGGPFQYAVFSGSQQTPLSMNGSNLNITGSIHTNNSFQSGSSNIKITGACEASNAVNIYGSNINVPNRVPNAPVIEMPDFSGTLKQQAQAAGQVYNGDKTFSGSNVNLDHPIYVKGNVTIAASNFTGKGCIVADGTITIAVSNLNQSADSSVCFYSINGNIVLAASNININGIYYAPNGHIQSSQSNLTVKGKVIGKTLQFSASNLTITDDASVLSSLPSQGIRLIK